MINKILIISFIIGLILLLLSPILLLTAGIFGIWAFIIGSAILIIDFILLSYIIIKKLIKIIKNFSLEKTTINESNPKIIKTSLESKSSQNNKNIIKKHWIKIITLIAILFVIGVIYYSLTNYSIQPVNTNNLELTFGDIKSIYSVANCSLNFDNNTIYTCENGEFKTIIKSGSKRGSIATHPCNDGIYSVYENIFQFRTNSCEGDFVKIEQSIDTIEASLFTNTSSGKYFSFKWHLNNDFSEYWVKEKINVGDEGYLITWQDKDSAKILFVRKNIYVSISSEAWPEIDKEKLIQLAQIIDNRILGEKI